MINESDEMKKEVEKYKELLNRKEMETKKVEQVERQRTTGGDDSESKNEIGYVRSVLWIILILNLSLRRTVFTIKYVEAVIQTNVISVLYYRFQSMNSDELKREEEIKKFKAEVIKKLNQICIWIV